METEIHSNMSLLSANQFSVNYSTLLNSSTDYFDPVQTAIFGSWLVVIIVASILGNLMVITVILRNRRMREARNGTNLFLFNLAISDLMVGVCMAPVSLNTLIYEEWHFSQWFCSMNSFFNTLFLFASTHTLMYMSIHKFVSIRRHSNGNPNPISRKICLIMISAAWLWGALFGILTISGLSKAVYLPKKMQCGPLYPRFIPRDAVLFFANFICNIIVPIIIMGVTYRKIFCILKRSALFRAQTATGGNCARRSEKGATKTLILVLSIFLLCWLPYVVYVNYALMLENKVDIPAYLNPLAYCSGFTNSICNPIIYAFRFQDFQTGYQDIFKTSSYIKARGNRRMNFKRQHRPSEETDASHRMSVPQLPECDHD